jgi:signal transduction histidine kinase
MLDRLEAVFDAQKAFVANTSHELRTPLAVMRSEVDVALDDPNASDDDLRSALRAVGDVVDRTSGLVTSMLALARAETIIDPRTVDLAAIASGVALEARLRHGDRFFEADLQPAPVAGDPVLLGQVVGNLVRNAVAYNRHGGTVVVRTRRRGDVVHLEVENDGPVVPPEVVAALFGRFVRRAPSDDGHGLGLAVCEAITRTHGGSISAVARSEGGLHVTVELPAAVDGLAGVDGAGAPRPERRGQAAPAAPPRAGTGPSAGAEPGSAAPPDPVSARRG